MQRNKGDIILEVRINEVKESVPGKLSESLVEGNDGEKLSIRKKLRGDPEEVYTLLQTLCETIEGQTRIPKEIKELFMRGE